MYTIVLLIQLLFGAFVFYLCLAFITGAPFVPSVPTAAQKMIELADIQRGETIYDLGSGDGRLLFLAAKKGASKARGVEINPFLVVFTWILAQVSPYRHQVSVQWKNFWGTNLQDADVVFVYLLPWRMEKLQRYLSSQLQPGTRIVSNSFIFPDWNIIRKDPTNHVYVFQID